MRMGENVKISNKTQCTTIQKEAVLKVKATADVEVKLPPTGPCAWEHGNEDIKGRTNYYIHSHFQFGLLCILSRRRFNLEAEVIKVMWGVFCEFCKF